MRGVKSETLAAIVDFLYCGEANVFQENLESFLAFADELRLKGLMGQPENTEKKADITCADPTPGQIYKREKSKPERRLSNMEPNLGNQQAKIQTNYENRIAIQNVESGNILQELDEKVKSMMENGQKISSNGTIRTKICKLCGKEGQSVAYRSPG